MATAPAAALPIISGTDSGETERAPFSIRFSLPCSSVPMPPMPVPIRQPMRSASYGSSSSQPASRSASSEETSANCVKRSARRTSFLERCSVGSNSVQRPAPSSMPDTPARQRS